MKKIKIGIDGGDFNPESTIQSGIQRLVSSFLVSIPLKQESSLTFYYYYFSKQSAHSNSKTIRYVNLPRKFFSFLFVPLKCFLDRINVYMGFSGIIPPIIRLFKKTVVFIHDFGFYHFPDYYPESEKFIWQTNYSVFAANKIIVFSKTVRNQLLNQFPTIKPDKVITIYPGVNYVIQSKATNERTINNPYFLYVGVIKKIKNIEKLLSLFEVFISETKILHVKLVLIGVKEQSYWEHIIKLPLFLKIQKNLIFLEHVSDKNLVFYYKHCIALLNTSLVEGFCYPVVEALSLGKKVITNDLPLYLEFKPYFEGLRITKSDNDFLLAMKEEFRKKKTVYSVKQNSFNWSKFSSKLLTVVKNIS